MNRAAPEVRRALRAKRVPVVQIDEPMMERAVERGGVSRGRLLCGGRAGGASGKHAHRARDGRARAGPGAGANAGSHTGADGGSSANIKRKKRQRGNPLTLLLSRGTVPVDNFLSIFARFAVLYNRPVNKKTR